MVKIGLSRVMLSEIIKPRLQAVPAWREAGSLSGKMVLCDFQGEPVCCCQSVSVCFVSARSSCHRCTSAWSRQWRVSDQEDRTAVAVCHQQDWLETDRVSKSPEVQSRGYGNSSWWKGAAELLFFNDFGHEWKVWDWMVVLKVKRRLFEKRLNDSMFEYCQEVTRQQTIINYQHIKNQSIICCKTSRPHGHVLCYTYKPVLSPPQRWWQPRRSRCPQGSGSQMTAAPPRCSCRDPGIPGRRSDQVEIWRTFLIIMWTTKTTKQKQ